MTLVELLVAMVIFSMLMTLVAQAVHQVALIVRVSQRSAEDLHSRWGAGWSVSGLLANMVAPPQQSITTPALTGSATQIRGFSTQDLSQQQMGITPFQLTLVVEQPELPAGKSASILLSAQPATKDVFTPLANSFKSAGNGDQVARFDEVVEFAYVNRAGQVSPGWPAVPVITVGSEVLPSTVLVRSAVSGRVLMAYAFQGETVLQPPPSKGFWEQQQ